MPGAVDPSSQIVLHSAHGAWPPCPALGHYDLRRMNWLLYQSLNAESLKIPP